MTALDDLSPLRQAPFSEAVRKLEELMTQSGCAFLIGAGCSKCAGLPLTEELTDKALQSPILDQGAKEILESLKKLFDGAPNANIEDYLSELIDLLAIADRRKARQANQNQVDLGGKLYSADKLRDVAEKIKRAIANIFECSIEIETHRKFIRAIHRPIRPGKTVGDKPIDYLCLNYDTLLEDALALEQIPHSDGLDGGVTGWWNPEMFSRSGLAARILKLHGSINWIEFPDDPLPRRVAKNVNLAPSDNQRILIWPASTKHRETQRDPYAQLLDIARQVLRPGIHTQRVLIVCGYSFGDSHINIEIDRALRESSGRLNLIVFTSDDKPTGQLKIWNEDKSVSEQVLIYSKRGFYHGTKADNSSADLLWWKFENITRLIGGER